MKRVLFVLFVLALTVLPITAQDSAPTLVAHENQTFGLSHLVPDGWMEAGPGIFARAASAQDATLLGVQAAPLPKDQLLNVLVQQIGLDEAPEPIGQITTEMFTWDEYRATVEAQGLSIGVSWALAENDGQSIVVLLQSLEEEQDALREAVYLPVIDSVMPLVEEVVEVPYTVEDVTFSHDDITLAGTLTLPEGEGQHPAVILITGSGPQNRDEEILGFRIFQQIADHLTRNGIAVLRYDDRGVGESSGEYDTSTAADFAVDASAAVDYLLTREDINPDEIGLLGHSEGGIVAPMTAVMNDNVGFVILMAGPAASGVDVLLLQQEMVLAGDETLDPALVEALRSTQRALLEATASGDEAAIEAAAIAQYEAIPEQIREELELGTQEEFVTKVLRDLTAPAMQFIAAYEPADNIRALDIPVLAVYGSLDVQVVADQNAPVMEDLLADNADGTVVIIDGANHLFQAAETGGLDEYATLDKSFTPEFLDTITNWLLERVTVAQ
ncbi:MAG: alpha/beta fold hydrolase [Anaerolineae bacterium]|nr:alpha/beta fold hydrolase [Anaerolineae bacterium]